MVLLTRSKRSLEPAFDENQASKIIKLEETTKNLDSPALLQSVTTPKTPTTPKSSAKSPKTPKVNLEEYLKEKFAPFSGDLPQEFIDYHTSEFIEGCMHILSKDPSLYSVMIFKNFKQFKRKTDPIVSDKEKIRKYWYSLICSVIAQQISGSAAQSIEKKFRALFNGKEPTPEVTLNIPFDELRAVGLSNQKTKYAQHISEAYIQNGNNLTCVEFYKTATVDELTKELCKLKGIGEWSAKMFILFTLDNMNVFADEDLGVARGMAKYLQNRPHLLVEAMKFSEAEEYKKLLSKKARFASKEKSKRDWIPIHDVYVRYIGSLFQPYQTIFMLILWRLSFTNYLLEESNLRDSNEKAPSVPSPMELVERNINA